MYKKYSKIKRRLLARHLNLVRVSLLAISLLFFVGVFSLARAGLKNTFFAQGASLAYSFLFTPESGIQKFNDRTNILLLGKSGQGSDSPEITDTIIVASITHTSPQSVSLISLPRDIWDDDISAKINASYKIGNERKENGGLTLAKVTVENIVGIPIHYGIVVNFNAFKETIDAIGGVDVYVEKSFTDTRFPIPGKENDECSGDTTYACRYETLSFEKGITHMNGEEALKYSRSRHSTDLEEGTDFARAKRQQQVINALRKKITSIDTLTNYSILKTLFSVFESNIETDMTRKQIALLARRVYQSQKSIESTVLPESLLFNPPLLPQYEYQYVFVSIREDGEWSDVKNYVREFLQ